MKGRDCLSERKKWEDLENEEKDREEVKERSGRTERERKKVSLSGDKEHQGINVNLDY